MKKLFIPLFILLFFSLSPRIVFSHILESSGFVGAVMHIDPADDPVVGEMSGFFFEFKDKENKFSPQNCDCTFSILQGEKEIYSQPLFANNTDPSLINASVFYTFPQKDIYKIKVSGNPKTTNAFQSFTLEYDIRVEKEAVSTQVQNTETNWFVDHIVHLTGAGVVVLFFIFALLKQRQKHS